MNKYIKSIALLIPAVAMLASCSMFQLDNYEGPNAEVSGKFYDMVTGEKQGVEVAYNAPYASWGYYDYQTLTTGALVVTELGYVSPTWGGDPAEYKAEGEQYWLVRFDGQFVNTRIFAAQYRFSTKMLPFYEPDASKNTFTIEKGKNVVNIGVLPFCRIKEPVITFDKATKKVIAKFYVELTDPSRANKISSVSLCGNTQLFVGCKYQNLAANDASATAKNVTPGELVTLEIDANTSTELFGKNKNTGADYVQDRYFRIAAMAEGNGYNTDKLYNFSATFKLLADFSDIVEVNWDEVEW